MGGNPFKKTTINRPPPPPTTSLFPTLTSPMVNHHSSSTTFISCLQKSAYKYTEELSFKMRNSNHKNHKNSFSSSSRHHRATTTTRTTFCAPPPSHRWNHVSPSLATHAAPAAVAALSLHFSSHVPLPRFAAAAGTPKTDVRRWSISVADPRVVSCAARRSPPDILYPVFIPAPREQRYNTFCFCFPSKNSDFKLYYTSPLVTQF